MLLKCLRKIKKDIDSEISIRRYARDEDGRIVIAMNVKDDKDFLSVFSKRETPVISEDVAEFIEHCALSVPPSEKLRLSITSECIDEKEREDYKKAIREYYTEKYLASKLEMKRNTFITILLSLIGILIISLSFLAASRVWSEVIAIIGWVFIWEAVHITAFQNRALRIKRMRYLSFIEMKISYKK